MNEEDTITKNVEERPAKVLSKEERYLKRLEEADKNQNFSLAIKVGIIVGLALSVLWAWISIESGYQLSILAIGLGAGIGATMWGAGKGRDEKFGFSAALIALLSIGFGNLIIAFHFMAMDYGSYSLAFSGFEMGMFLQYIRGFIHLYDFIFVLIAMGAAFKLAFKTVEEEMGMY